MGIRVLHAALLAASLVGGWASPSEAFEMRPVELGIDRLGSDFSAATLPRNDTALCQDQCAVTARCVAWSYVPVTRRCFLKDAAPFPTVNGAVSSGVKTLR